MTTKQKLELALKVSQLAKDKTEQMAIYTAILNFNTDRKEVTEAKQF